MFPNCEPRLFWQSACRFVFCCVSEPLFINAFHGYLFPFLSSLCSCDVIFCVAVPIVPGCKQMNLPRSQRWSYIDENGEHNTNKGCAGQWGPDENGIWGWSEPVCESSCNGCVESFDKCVACQPGLVKNGAGRCVGKPLHRLLAYSSCVCRCIMAPLSKSILSTSSQRISMH